MYKIKYSRKFKKSLKKLNRSGFFDKGELIEVIDLLASGANLTVTHKDHELKGDLSCFRECHVQTDILLIYQINIEDKILLLVDIGSHSKLFGK